MLVGGLDVGWQKLTNGLSDFGDWCSKLLGSGIADTLGSIESIDASIGTIAFRSFGVEGAMYHSAGAVEHLQRRVDDARQWHELS